MIDLIIIGAAISGTLGLIGVIYKVTCDQIQANANEISDVWREIRLLHKKWKEEHEQMMDFIERTAALSIEDKETLIRIDERVSKLCQLNTDVKELRSDLNDVKQKVDYLHEKNGGD